MPQAQLSQWAQDSAPWAAQTSRRSSSAMRASSRYVAAWMWAARVETAAARASSSMVEKSSAGIGWEVGMKLYILSSNITFELYISCSTSTTKWHAELNLPLVSSRLREAFQSAPYGMGNLRQTVSHLADASATKSSLPRQSDHRIPPDVPVVIETSAYPPKAVRCSPPPLTRLRQLSVKKAIGH